MKLDQIVHPFTDNCLELMKSRKFMEFNSFSLLQLQWTFLINTPLSIVIQFLRRAASTRMDMLLVIVFSA